MSIARNPAWKALKDHAKSMHKTHLRELLGDRSRCTAMRVHAEDMILDYSRQNATPDTMRKLLALAESAQLSQRIADMFAGAIINTTEQRAVLHTALRAPKTAQVRVDDRNVMPDIHKVLGQIRRFSNAVRKGQHLGATGKPLRDVVAIGIGGSYLGPEFVYEALRSHPACARAAGDRRLRFLANVDPIDVHRALEGLDPATTLVVVVSKTFTTAETMLNARSVRDWLTKSLGKKAVAQHMVAVSTNLEAVQAFGINPDNAFAFWDWVGGRYSVCSAVGMLPLALQFGFAPCQQFLAGAHRMDEHFRTAPLADNLPVILGLLGVWNSSFLGHSARALLPYCQALHKFAPHIQQVDMESNGKGVDANGKPLPFAAGEIDFGEPGTNGQHSFYQLLHQGRVIPADFIGFKRSQQPRQVREHGVSNHDELMANFFAQPDALALGKTAEALRAEGVADELIPHKVFPGNRPSSSLLLDELSPSSCGQLLALYEHRTAVQGFIWGINSFDQMGVELGKILAKNVVADLAALRGNAKARVKQPTESTAWLLRAYCS